MSRPSLLFRNSPVPYTGVDTWRAAVNYNTDGDTQWVERDTGCRDTDLIELRITSYEHRPWDADERFTVGGKLVTGLLRLWAPEASIVLIRTLPDPEKYGRWLSPVLIPLPDRAEDFIRPVHADDTLVLMNKLYVDFAKHATRVYPDYCRWKDSWA